MAMRVIDDTILQGIAEAIQEKDNGGQMTVDEMAGRIDNIIVAPIQNPALILWDWEGTKLAAYSREDALALTELPAPSTLPAYADVDHELLLFQKWHCSLANIKTWIQNHEGETRGVGAIYTTTDRQDHNFWNSPRLDTAKTISMQKRGTASIGGNAFSDCVTLAQINIPEGVTSIGSGAFYDCVSLAQINIPDSVTSIAEQAFHSCYSLKRINIPDSVIALNYNTFYNCYSLKQINIPDSVTYIGEQAFYTCLSLKRINIPDSVTSIGSGAFRSCYSLKRINIPDNVIRINDYTFHNCYSLKQINIPDSVTSIGEQAFYNCKTLCDVLLESKPTLANTNAFGNLPSNYRIYVPRENLPWFETATNWSIIYTQGHIVAIEDYIDYLESIGFNVDAYKGATA